MTERKLYPAEQQAIQSIIEVHQFVDPTDINKLLVLLGMYLRVCPLQTKQLIQAVLGFVPEEKR